MFRRKQVESKHVSRGFSQNCYTCTDTFCREKDVFFVFICFGKRKTCVNIFEDFLLKKNVIFVIYVLMCFGEMFVSSPSRPDW